MIPHQNGRSEARQPDSLTFADQHRWREVQLTADVSPSAAHRLATASAVERKPAGDEKEGGGGGGGRSLASKRGCVMDRGSWLGAEYGRNSGVIGL